MTLPLFVFGTLRDPVLRDTVAGTPLLARPASLPDHRIGRAIGADGRPQPFPVLEAAPGQSAFGHLLFPGPEQQARLDLYEKLFRYDVAPLEVECDGGRIEALVYLPQEGSWRAGPDWSLEVWAGEWGELRRRAAAEIMYLARSHPLASLAERYPMIEVKISSEMRAEADAAARRASGLAAGDLLAPRSPQDVRIEARRDPYAHFFGVQEADLRIRRFSRSEGDGFSAPVTRAGFVIGDAVTVLPWDPLRDLVLVTDQFRFGPFLRGDPNPWSLEPVAGRIDAGEAPDEAGRREAREEAGLEIGRMIQVASYYPSPGAVTEYLYSFIGLADLSGYADGHLGGLAEEGEDIRSHVLPLARLETMMGRGELTNAPLLISLLWLLREGPGLRAAGRG